MIPEVNHFSKIQGTSVEYAGSGEGASQPDPGRLTACSEDTNIPEEGGVAPDLEARTASPAGQSENLWKTRTW